MANPTVTYRSTPPGQPMKDGYRSLIAFAANPSVLFWEVSPTPPGIDNGEPIDTTNMHTGTWRVFRPRALRTLTPISCEANYHPLMYPQIEALCGIEGSITFHFPTGNYCAFYGYLRSAIPVAHVEGEDPTLSVVIQPTNWDPVNNVTVGPLTGTGT
jgi:hypothetical protein